MLVLAFDPGTHTGVARYDTLAPLERGSLHTLTVSAVSPDNNANVYQDLWRLLSTVGDYKLRGLTVTIVIERFNTVSAGVAASKDGIFTQKLCGFLEGVALCMGYIVVWQTPTARKAFEDRAKDLLRNRDSTVHEVSATAHLLAYVDRTLTHVNAVKID